MRHQRKSRRFGRSTSHRLAMFRNMVTSLFVSERILTTLEKAKELRRIAEPLITLSKNDTVAARRLAAKRLRTTRVKDGDRIAVVSEALDKLFETLGPRFKDRPGGYTRIVRTVNRRGDNASMAFIELLPEEKKSTARKTKKSTKKKAADKE